jgi:hypothetical protein
MILAWACLVASAVGLLTAYTAIIAALKGSLK